MMRPTASDVLAALRQKGFGLATAESCTGGMIGAALTAIPGSSDTYRGGVISYTNQVKQQLLGVPKEILEQYGAVSAPVAQAMALGAAKALSAEAAVATTGLAGPSGDEFGNPMGTVYIACALKGKVKVVHCLFHGDRRQIRQAAMEKALELILSTVKQQFPQEN